MKLTVLNSNSSGNCYILEQQGRAILLDVGVKLSQITQALGFNLLKVEAALLTHEHRDHSRSAEAVAKYGVELIASEGTIKAAKLTGLGRDIRNGQKVRLQSYDITAFNVDHDAAEPLGFIVEHKDYGPILYATDTYIMRYSFKHKFKAVIIEANYCEDIRKAKLSTKGRDYVESRRPSSHLSIQSAILWLKSADLSECTAILLIHLSDGLSDEQGFKKQIEAATGIQTYIAAPGLIVELSI